MYPRIPTTTLLARTLFGFTVLVSTNLWAQTQNSPSLIEAVPVLAKEPTGTLTLAAAIDLALTANPELSAAANELQAVEGAVIQAGVLPNPDISSTVEDTQNKATRTTTVQINQMIELGGKRAARIASAERGRDVAAAELAAKRQEVRASVVGAFFDVLVAQERVLQAEDLLGLAKRATQAASRRVTAGKVARRDRDSASARRDQAPPGPAREPRIGRLAHRRPLHDLERRASGRQAAGRRAGEISRLAFRL